MRNRINFLTALILAVLIGVVFSFLSDFFASSVLPENPFGMGAAFGEWNLTPDPKLREMQLRQTLYLAGRGGHVRLWCNPYDVIACQDSINRAYELDLVPVIMVQMNYYANDSQSPHRDFKSLAGHYAWFVDQLPVINGRNLLIELANEPNFTDMWFSQTCSYVTRAIEVAQASAQILDKVKSLNKPQIKMLFVALSPYSDSNPIPTGDGKCKRGTRNALASTTFVTKMKKERPDLFSKIDAWNSHPYSLEDYYQCTRPNCPLPKDDAGLTAYRQEMQVAGMPSDFPVYLTEVGTYWSISSLLTADRFVHPADYNLGIYPEIWLADLPYNNVKGIMPFILPLDGFDFYAWLNPCGSVSETPPYQTARPIYNRVRSLRVNKYGDSGFALPSFMLPTVDYKCTYRSDWDFSNVQGTRGWRFLESSGRLMTFDPAEYIWKGAETDSFIAPISVHPGSDVDVIRRWTAPKEGSIRVSGSARGWHTGCDGAGVHVIILKNDTILWDQTIPENSTTAFGFDLTVSVGASDRIDFSANSESSDNGCAMTKFHPTITYL